MAEPLLPAPAELAEAPESPESPQLNDALGRRIDYMRLSLTDRCNFRCIYCMPRQGLPLIQHADILSYEELLRLAGVFAGLGISKYKITGGEPLCRKGAVGFIGRLAALPGVREVTLTTNGSLALPQLAALAESGLRSVTFSLDALDGEVFRRITRSESSLEGVLRSVCEALRLGLRVKLNAVPLKGVNEDQLLPLAAFALENGVQARFIELMPVGMAREFSGLGRDELRARLEREFGPLSRVAERSGNGPAEVFSLPGKSGSIGFIAAMSHRFCQACNRVRLTSTGFLKTCLYHDHGADLRAVLRHSGLRDPELGAELRRIIVKTIQAKPAGHDFGGTTNGGGFFMNTVGG